MSFPAKYCNSVCLGFVAKSHKPFFLQSFKKAAETAEMSILVTSLQSVLCLFAPCCWGLFEGQKIRNNSTVFNATLINTFNSEKLLLIKNN